MAKPSRLRVQQVVLSLLFLLRQSRALSSRCSGMCVLIKQRTPVPTSNGGMQNESSVGICTRRMHVFARLAPICMPSRCLVTKISASELSQKFVKCALLGLCIVGMAVILLETLSSCYRSLNRRLFLFLLSCWFPFLSIPSSPSPPPSFCVRGIRVNPRYCPAQWWWKRGNLIHIKPLQETSGIKKSLLKLLW